MKVGPEPQASVASASRPETQESRFRVEKVDEIGQHGIAIGGMFISNNCNTILLVMSLIFIIGGVIFTAISYRPQVSDEDMQQYRDRQMSEDVSQVLPCDPAMLSRRIWSGDHPETSSGGLRVPDILAKSLANPDKIFKKN